MHSQVLVIYPFHMDLEDVMYPYQEIDKYPYEKIMDDRCQWFLTVKEEEIPFILGEIEDYLKESRDEYLEVLQYRTEHSYGECKEKYGGFVKRCFESYKYYSDNLKEFLRIKDLPINHPKQIKFINKYGGYATERWIDMYIENIGYGVFHNPYELWDFYTPIYRRFGYGVEFLVDKEGNKSNELYLDMLDVDETVKNISELTYVWEHIIFCETESKSRLYTVDDIRFNKKCNSHCLVDNLKSVLYDLAGNEHGEMYCVKALDTHW